MYIFKSKNVNALLMKCLKIPKEISEAVFLRTDNTMAKNTNKNQLNATQKTNN